MALYVYCMGPLDFWGGWMSFAEAAGKGREPNAWDCISPDEIEHVWSVAKAAARELGWEGDVRQGPFIAGFPSPTREPGFLVAWKQDNNGTTFIASPVPLPHLEHEGASSFRVR